jgi:hypothetical protein
MHLDEAGLKRLATFMLGILLWHSAYALELFGTVDAVHGEAFISDGTGTPTAASVGLKILEGQTIRTAAGAELHVVTADGGFIALRPATLFRVDEYKSADKESGHAAMQLLKGAVRSITGWIGKKSPSSYRLGTTVATIGIRGTDHETTVIEDPQEEDEPGTYETVIEGVTFIRTPYGEIDIHPGQYAFAPRDGEAPPVILEKPPEFSRRRTLVIEDRIQSRKEFLINFISQLSDENKEQMEALQDNWETMTDAQRDAAKRKIRKKIYERRN